MADISKDRIGESEYKSVTFSNVGGNIKFTLNGVECVIEEGKYPEDWIWEISFSNEGFYVEVMKTVSFDVTLKQEDIAYLELEGRPGGGGLTEREENQASEDYYRFQYINGSWDIIGCGESPE